MDDGGPSWFDAVHNFKVQDEGSEDGSSVQSSEQSSDSHDESDSDDGSSQTSISNDDIPKCPTVSHR